MRILFYTPLNNRCRDIESQAVEFKKYGHDIFLLTQSPIGVLHENFKSYGFKVRAKPRHSFNTKITTFLRMVDLIFFCYKHKIDIIYSHLEPANFIAVLSRFLVKSRVVICRHHVDEAGLYPFGEDLSYKLTYKLCKEVIVVSNRAKKYMIDKENIPAEKIHQINLAYDFFLYDQANKKKC